MERPEKLAGALMRTLKGMDLELRAREARAMALWPEIVGPVTAEKTRPLYVNRGTMVVGVASSAWANQLNLLKNKLLIGLEERVGPGVIRDLRWKSGPWDAPDRGLPVAGRRSLSGDRGPELAVPEADRQAIARLIGEIPDPRLAAKVERTLLAQARRRERLRAVGWVPCARCGVLHDRAERAIARAREAEAFDVILPPAGSRVLPPESQDLCPVCHLETRGGEA